LHVFAYRVGVAHGPGRGWSSTDVEAVLFDVGGVLMIPDPEAFRGAVAPLGLTPDDDLCHAAVLAATQAMDEQALPTHLMDWNRVNAACARTLGVYELDHRVLTAVAAAFREAPYVPVPGAAEVLTELSTRGYRLAVVSNAHGTIEAQLAAHGICSTSGDRGARVEVIVDSTIVCVDKPDREIFQLALDALGVRASRAIYVGDSDYFDVHGATRAGLHALHVDPLGTCTSTTHPDVADVRHILQRLR
jgi:putative hydrolase of the HAD superfamily